MPSKKKKYNARFPAGRIKKIMQTDEEVGKVAQAVPVIIYLPRTLELFVESLLKKSMQITQTRNAKTLTPSHMKQCILSESRFDFLKDLVRDIPDASVQEDNENNAIFEESLHQNDDIDVAVPVPSHSKRKQSSSDGGSKEGLAHKQIDLNAHGQSKKRKLPATEVSSTSTSSSSSPLPVSSSPTHTLAPITNLSAPNYYKEHHQQQSTTNRTPVIQYGPKISHQKNNQYMDDASQASQLSFSVKNLLNQKVNNVICEEPNLRVTIASEHLAPPPLAVTTYGTSAGNVLPSRLAPSGNVPPLVPLRMPPATVAASAAPKYVPTLGDLSIDEDYDN